MRTWKRLVNRPRASRGEGGYGRRHMRRDALTPCVRRRAAPTVRARVLGSQCRCHPRIPLGFSARRVPLPEFLARITIASVTWPLPPLAPPHVTDILGSRTRTARCFARLSPSITALRTCAAARRPMRGHAAVPGAQGRPTLRAMYTRLLAHSTGRWTLGCLGLWVRGLRRLGRMRCREGPMPTTRIYPRIRFQASRSAVGRVARQHSVAGPAVASNRPARPR
jgi:hypothetical protein